MNRPMGKHGGYAPDEKGQGNQKKAFASLAKALKPYFIPFGIALVFAIAGTVLTVIGPDKLRDMTNYIAEGMMGVIDIDSVISIAWTLLAMYAASVLLSYGQGFITATITQRVCNKLRDDISHKINRLPLRYFDSTAYGDILSRVTNDVDTIGQTLNQSVGNLVAAVALLVGSLVMMFKTDWIMALTAIGASIFGFIFMSLVIGRSQKYFTAKQRELGEINGHVEEIYAGHNVVKAYNAEGKARERFEDINNRLYKSSWMSQFLSGLMPPMMGFIGNFGYVAVCVVGAMLAIDGRIEFGVIVAFMVYVRLFTQPLSQIAQAATNLQSTAAASNRVFDFLGEKEMQDESAKTDRLENVRGDIEFRNIRFSYDGERTIINNFSAKAGAGQKIAIVGPTGAGKTTMVNLLMRFYEPQEGDILIDGVPISSLTRENVHSLFGMVLQDTWLFEGTIRDNIIYGKEGVTDEDVRRACKALGIDHFIRTLSHGYDTVLDEDAAISSGQKQMITLARAMIENAPLLILDEATSSVDTRTELIIQEAMDTLMHGRTSFIIAHRLSTIRNADLILVMRDGDIVESGNHETLLAKNGFYADLYNSQFETSA